ncbi:MAG TPA: DUF6677 family protein [Pirellulales bacterium]
MSKTTPGRDAGAPSATEETPLKDPVLAATLAWLIPGLGHWYQGRRSKALLFFVCILGTFVFGLYLGEGRVVYASMRPGDNRFPYFCQVAVGLPALPALVQAYRVNHRDAPINFGLWKDFMVPPALTRPGQDNPSELDKLHKRLNRFFELGTVYTMVAGLLNVLAIYDAFAGPAEGNPSNKRGEGGEASSAPREAPS